MVLFFLGLAHQAYGKFFEIQKVGKTKVIVLLQGERVFMGESFLILDENNKHRGVAEVVAMNKQKALLKFYGEAKKGYILTSTLNDMSSPPPPPPLLQLSKACIG